MKKTQEIHLLSSGEDMDAVLNEAVEFSKNMNLSEKEALRIRLLTEETLGMIRTLTGGIELAICFIGNENECIIRVETDTMIDALEKQEILAVSSTGKNVLVKGIMGKIRDVFETVFLMPMGADFSMYAAPSMMIGMPTDVYSGQLMDTVYWTLNSYKKNVRDGKEWPQQEEYWDELEKSIVSNIADDVQVGVKNGHVVMSIIYKCGK